MFKRSSFVLYNSSSNIFEEKNTTCHHCGGDCPEQPLHADERDFCCQGCLSVYELLKDKGMELYYGIETKAPGNKVNEASDTERYAYLDLPAIRERLIEFSEGGLSKITFTLPAIHCSSCIWLLENLPRLHPGVQSARVDFLKKRAEVLFLEEKLSLRSLVEFLARLGYEPHISLASGAESKPSVDRGVYYKLGIAGFAFGNIMLLSFPEYLTSSAEEIAPEYRLLFGYLNFVLALPVVFYCASGYFRSAWQGIRHGIANIDIPIALGILALFGQSSYEIFSGAGAGYMDSLAGLLFFLLIGKWYQNKLYAALSFERDYRSYFPIAVTRLDEEGRTENVPVADLRAGDRIRLRNREVVPADGVLLSPSARFDYSFVTGESLPVDKVAGERVYAGGRQLGASIELRLLKAVEQSRLTALWNKALYDKSDQGKRFSRLIAGISRRFTLTVLGIALLAGLYYGVWGGGAAQAVHIVASVLIITCPCALALAMPTASGTAMRLLGRWGLYLKNSAVVEQLSEVKALVFDKTGTLTQAGSGDIAWQGQPLTAEQLQAVAALTAHSTHPLSRALHAFVCTDIQAAQAAPVQDFDEVPGKGISGRVNGKFYRLGARIAGEPSEGPAELSASDAPPASLVWLEEEGLELGCFVLQKSYRPGLEGLFGRLRAAGYELYLLSGDNDSERERLLPLFGGRADRLHFRQSPEDKLRFVEALQARGERAAMIGDGLNDAGALRAAHAGIALAEDVHSFTPAGDAILAAEELARLDELLRLSRRSMRAVRLSVLASLFYNLIGLSFALRGALTPLVAAVLMPLSSVSVVLFVTGFLACRARVGGRL